MLAIRLTQIVYALPASSNLLAPNAGHRVTGFSPVIWLSLLEHASATKAVSQERACQCAKVRSQAHQETTPGP